MHKTNYYIINAITLYRLVSAPFLILLILYHQIGLFKILLVVSFLTDLIDGFLARRFKTASVYGARIDSVADDLTIIAAITAMVIYKPEFIKEEIIVILELLVLYVLQTVLSLVRYGKISSFHTYTAKLAAILQGIFLIFFFFLPEPVYLLFTITTIVTIIDLLEEIILVLLLPKWETNIKGLYWILKKRNSSHPPINDQDHAHN